MSFEKYKKFVSLSREDALINRQLLYDFINNITILMSRYIFEDQSEFSWKTRVDSRRAYEKAWTDFEILNHTGGVKFSVDEKNKIFYGFISLKRIAMAASYTVNNKRKFDIEYYKDHVSSYSIGNNIIKIEDLYSTEDEKIYRELKLTIV